MTTRQTSIDEDHFQAFVDGQLPPEQCRAVMAYLAANPDESSRMSDYRTLNEALHRTFDEVLYEPLPKRLKVDYYLDRTPWWQRVRSWVELDMFRLVPRFAAFAALMFASGAAGWWLNDEYRTTDVETPAMSFARQAANAHLLYAPDVRHPVEFGADQQDSLLMWLSERLGESVHAPNLQELGFGLVGGRLLPAATQAAAQLMYEDPATTQRITLYIRGRWNAPLSGATEGAVSYAGEGGASMVYWIEGPLAYALIGEMDREQLFSAAKSIQQQLQLPGLPTPIEQTAEKNAT